MMYEHWTLDVNALNVIILVIFSNSETAFMYVTNNNITINIIYFFVIGLTYLCGNTNWS